MPELVLKDVSAQDAADLLAFLITLREDVQPVTRYRVLGPIAAKGGDALDREYPVEKSLATPDLAAQYPGVDGKTVHWEEVATESPEGYAAIDSVRYDNARKLPSAEVVHYFLVFADSTADQEAGLLLGTDDGCKVWINGQVIHHNPATRALGPAQDRLRVKLHPGRNTIVIKVVNGNGPGGITLAITSASGVTLKTE